MSGFSSHANTVIRNNKRKRINKLDRVERYIGTKTSEAEYNEASEYMLHKIRDNVQKQQRKTRRMAIIVFLVFGVIISSFMYYFLFMY
ncbi:MAG: hypothetical protein AB8B65_18270 [Kordia sp.]|uniref:hypothetical protein n=1 Tax=Kordia sp. TaxID=1965332 RepID=UPI0038590C84